MLPRSYFKPAWTKISEIMFFQGNAQVKGSLEPRGEIYLLIRPDGTVTGQWHGYYYKARKIHYDIIGANFVGSIYSSNIYSDQNGQDPSKLYFLTRGKYLMQETNPDRRRVTNKGGYNYVRGWIGTDYKVTGEITITPNEKYFEAFEMTATKVRR